MLLGATSSLRYFTGFAWHPSERFCRAIVHADRVDYVVPCFELEKVSQLIGVPDEVLTWEEDEDPYRLIARQLGAKARLGLDDQIALFMFQRLRRAMGDERLADAGAMIKQAAPAQIRR